MADYFTPSAGAGGSLGGGRTSIYSSAPQLPECEHSSAFKVVREVSTTEITTADNVINIFQFPSIAHLDRSSLRLTWTDLDTNATETLDFKLAVSAAETGASATALLIPAAGAEEDAGDAGIVVSGTSQDDSGLLDVGGDWCHIHIINAPATDAAGTITVEGVYYRDVVTRYVASVASSSGTSAPS